MTKVTQILLVFSLVSVHSFADDIRTADGPLTHESNKEIAGFSMGALIGGLLAGPPGTVIGASAGGVFGGRDAEPDKEIVALEKLLNTGSIELAYRQNESAETSNEYETELQQLSYNRHMQSLEKLSEGIVYSVYYKTNDAQMRADIRPQLQKLAELIKPYKAIQIQIEGYADRRGAKQANLELSRERINNVREEFLKAGINRRRLQTHAYGERRAAAEKDDHETYIFDRRVTISLTLNREV